MIPQVLSIRLHTEAKPIPFFLSSLPYVKCHSGNKNRVTLSPLTVEVIDVE